MILALTVFSIGHVVAALSTSFSIVLIARVVTALATGAFWSVGGVVATTAAGPQNATRAIGVMIGGLTLANVIGVPVGSLVGQLTGWRGPCHGGVLKPRSDDPSLCRAAFHPPFPSGVSGCWNARTSSEQRGLPWMPDGMEDCGGG